MAEGLHLSPRHREEIEALLHKHLPGVEVWAYGSRVNGRSHDGSDLDLVLRGPQLAEIDISRLADFIEALQDSTIPFLVEARDWARLPKNFHSEIEREHVALVGEEESGMASGRRYIPASKFCASVRDGTHDSPKPVERGRKLVTSRHLTTGQLDLSNAYLISEEDFEYINKRSKVDKWDVLISMIGTVGEPCLIKEEPDFAIKNIGLFKTRSEADGKWLYYYLRSKAAQKSIREQSRGTTQQYIPLGALRGFPILVADDLEEQKTIAHILGTLDDKIELNRRMNETLEAMARALFKSWFVDFDPVRATMAGRDPGLPPHLADLFPDRLVDSELGEIPEGWEVKALEEFGDVITGKTPSTRIPEFYGDDVPFLKIPDMHGQMYVVETSTMLSSVGASSQALKTLPSGSISVSCIATPGLVVLNHRNIQTNQQINSVIPRNQLLSKYLYWSCRHLSTNIKTGGLGGSVFGNMNKSTFSALPVLNPESAAIRAFDQFVSPIHAAMLANEEQNQTLAEGRDSLLPKLISGELRPKVAKRIVEIA